MIGCESCRNMSGRTNVCRKKKVTPHEGKLCGEFAPFPMKRDLDGCYFRVKRDGRWGNACFSDMTPDEIEEMIGDRPASWWKSLACHLGERLREVGDKFDIIASFNE